MTLTASDKVHCHICRTDFPARRFAEHLDKHSDTQWQSWPGGLGALEQLLMECSEIERDHG